MPPAPQSSPPRAAATVARFCLSCIGTLACWCVWLVLGAILVVQAYIVVAHELPVPRVILGLLDSKLAAENLAASFQRAQFDPTGRIFLESARIRLLQFDDPLVVADTLYVRKSPWSVLSGARAPDEIRLTGATVQLPAPLSPSGVALPLLRDGTATLRIDGSLVHVDQLTARVGNVVITLHGDYQLAPRAPGAERPPLGETIAKVLGLARRFAREIDRLDCLVAPSLHAELNVRPGIGNVAEIELHADGLREPMGLAIETGPLRAVTQVRLDGEADRPLRLAFNVERLTYGEEALTAEALEGDLTTQFAPRTLTAPVAAQLQLAAAHVSGYGETLGRPVLAARWAQGGALDLALGFAAHGRTLQATAQADLAARTARVELEGVVPPALVTAVLTARAPRVEPYLRFLDPVQTHATATLGPGWRFDLLRARVNGARLDSNGVQVDAFRGRIDLDRDLNFLAYDADVTAGRGGHARGIYWMNFRRMDFRILLTGGLQPPDIAGWFRSRWWLDFWENIRFPAAVPLADVDVQGNYRDSTNTTYFGSTDARDAIVLGADFEAAHARVFVRPHFAHAFDLTVRRAGGAQQAAGWFKRISDPATRELRAYEFDLAGNLEAATLRQLGGASAESLVAPWKFTAPAQLAFAGRTEFRAGRSTPDLRFRVETTAPATYEGFPVERLMARGGVSGPDIRVDEMQLTAAGGRGTVKAALSGEDERRRLGFDFYLEGADLVQAIRAMSEYEAAHAAPGERPPSPNRELLKRASGGRLNFALSAQGRPGDLATFNGSGNLELKGAELGEIHLFGLLSQLLSGLSLKFSTLKLDTLRGSFRVADGRVNFPDVKVTGPNALIEGRGDYRLVDKTLDFTARFKPYEENKTLLTAAIGIVVNPLASILELRLTGPIAKPNWSVSLGSSTPKEAPLPPQPGAAGATLEPKPTPPEKP